MPNILIIGTVSWDTIIKVSEFYSSPVTIFAESYRQTLGGTSAGKALNLAHLGFNVKLITKFADDEAGRNIESYLNSEEIDFTQIKDENSSEMHTNLMNDKGERISIYTHIGKTEQPINLTLFEEDLRKADIIMLDICEFVKRFFPILKDYREKIWLDIHDYDGKNEWHKVFIPYAGIIFMSSDAFSPSEELNVLMKELLRNRRFVVCTHGKKGSEILTEGGEIYSEGIIEKFQPVDTNGAGDSFASGFLYAYLKEKNLADCLKYGTIVSGLTVTSTELYSPELSPDWIEEEFDKNYKLKTTCT